MVKDITKATHNAVEIPLWGHCNPCTLHPISAGFTGLCPSGTGNRSSFPMTVAVQNSRWSVFIETWLVDEYHLWGALFSRDLKKKTKINLVYAIIHLLKRTICASRIASKNFHLFFWHLNIHLPEPIWDSPTPLGLSTTIRPKASSSWPR